MFHLTVMGTRQSCKILTKYSRDERLHFHEMTFIMCTLLCTLQLESTYSRISSVTSSMSLKERSSQAMFSGHSTRSRASWYKPCVSTRLLLESLMTLLLYLRPVGPHQILTNQNFQSPQPTVQTASAFVSWDFVWDIWLVGRTGWRCSWRSSPGEGRIRPAVLSPWPGTVTVCLYQITLSPPLTSTAG